MTRTKVGKLNAMLKHLFNAVTEDDFMQVYTEEQQGRPRQGIRVGKRKLSDAEVRNLATQAELLQSLELWGMIVASMRHAANESIFQRARVIDDIVFGKAMLYVLDVMEKKIAHIKNIG